MNILLVDDNQNDVTLFQEYIKRLIPNMVLTICTNAGDAFNVIKTQEFEYAFIDLFMPGMDGISLIKAVGGANRVKKMYLFSGANREFIESQSINIKIDGIIDKNNMQHELKELFP